MSGQVPQYSDAALERQRAVEEKIANGGSLSWTDMHGLLEPHPDLPQCQSWDGGYDHQCERAKGHDGPHRHVIEWGQPAPPTCHLVACEECHR